MRIGRTLPPAAAPIYLSDILRGIAGAVQGKNRLGCFEEELKTYYEMPHCFLVSSGKAALTLILQALKELYPERNEVVIPAYNCYSVPSAIVRSGLTVKLCDINPLTLDFNYVSLSALLEEGQKKILAVVPTHLFGLPADIPRVKSIVPNQEITVIEDSAQAMGGTVHDKKLGTLGDISFFSLGRGKAFSTVEGGIILTRSHKIAQKIVSILTTIEQYDFAEICKVTIMALLLAIFQKPFLFWIPKSLPFLNLGETIYDPYFKIRKLSSFQAGLASGWQKKLSMFIQARKNNTKILAGMIKDEQFNVWKRDSIALIRLPIFYHDSERKNRILAESDKQGLGIMPTYPAPINCICELRDFFSNQIFISSQQICDNLITIPIHPLLNSKDIYKIMSVISDKNC